MIKICLYFNTIIIAKLKINKNILQIYLFQYGLFCNRFLLNYLENLSIPGGSYGEISTILQH